MANVLGYLAKEKYNSVTFFLAIGLLSSYFTKNMTVVLLISILSTALVSTQRVIEGNVGSMGNSIVKDTKMADIVKENVGVGSDDSASSQGFPNGVTAVFDSASSKLTISGTPTEAGNFSYTVNFKSDADGKTPEKVSGTMTVEGAIGVESPKKSGVCKAADPNDDPGNCDDFLESDCVGKCKWNPILSQPEKSSMKATEKAKGGNPDEFKKFCLKELNDSKDATHTKGDGNDIKYFKKHDYVNGSCPVASSKDLTCEKKGDPACEGYKVFSGFSNMGKRNNIVANTSREGRVDGVDESEGDRIDYAETTKQAYDNLQNMLGADGMKGLASETQKLVAQQKELVDSLGQMAPVLNSAKSTLDSLNLPDMKGITNILSTLKGK